MKNQFFYTKKHGLMVKRQTLERLLTDAAYGKSLSYPGGWVAADDILATVNFLHAAYFLEIREIELARKQKRPETDDGIYLYQLLPALMRKQAWTFRKGWCIPLDHARYIALSRKNGDIDKFGQPVRNRKEAQHGKKES